MGKTHVLSTIVFVLFCLSMIIFYVSGLILPEQTNYWLVRDGLGILFLEFFSIFALWLMPGKYSLGVAKIGSESSVIIRDHQQADHPVTLIRISQTSGLPQIEQKVVDTSQIPNNPNPPAAQLSTMVGSWFVFLMILFMAFTITYFLDIYLFIYFLLALAVRYYFLRKSTDEEKSNEWIKSVVIPAASIVFSAFVARVLMDPILPSFSHQITVLKLYFQAHAPTWIHFKGIMFDNPGYIALWGVVYFVFILLFTLLANTMQKKSASSGSFRYVGIYK